jgi:hypothetical protein
VRVLVRRAACVAWTQRRRLQATRRRSPTRSSASSSACLQIVALAKMHAVRRARATLAEARDILAGNDIVLDYHVARHLCDIEAIHTYNGTDTVHPVTARRRRRHRPRGLRPDSHPEVNPIANTTPLLQGLHVVELDRRTSRRDCSHGEAVEHSGIDRDRLQNGCDDCRRAFWVGFAARPLGQQRA